MKYRSTKRLSGFSTCFRQHAAEESHCRFLHGYALEFKITFVCEQLDHRNWCYDFGNMKKIKEHLCHLFDHTCVVAKDDPKMIQFKKMEADGLIQLRTVDAVGCEKFAELVARYIDRIVQAETFCRVSVRKVRCIENKNNSATFIMSTP